MPTQTISAKEFRLNMPKVWDAVARGESFRVIRRSKPIARVVPDEEDAPTHEHTQQEKSAPKPFNSLDLWINPPAHMRIKSKKSAVELIRELRD